MKDHAYVVGPSGIVGNFGRFRVSRTSQKTWSLMEFTDMKCPSFLGNSAGTSCKYYKASILWAYDASSKA